MFRRDHSWAVLYCSDSLVFLHESSSLMHSLVKRKPVVKTSYNFVYTPFSG